MTLAAKLRRAPLRIATGAYILNSGLTKFGADDDTAKALHGMGSGAYPALQKVPPKNFVTGLAVAETVVGGALLAPFVPAGLAGLALAGFAGSLLGMWWRTPGMHEEGSIKPTVQGTPIAKDVWMLGVGTSLVLDSAFTGTRVTGDAAELKADLKAERKAARKAARQAAKASAKDSVKGSVTGSAEHGARELGSTAAKAALGASGVAAKVGHAAGKQSGRIAGAKEAATKGAAVATKGAAVATKSAEAASKGAAVASKNAAEAARTAVTATKHGAEVASKGMAAAAKSAAAVREHAGELISH